MVHIILAGEQRGNFKTWQNVKSFAEYHKAKIYVGSINKWDWDIDSEYVETKLLQDTMLNISEHPHRENYIIQWSSLYQCYNHFKHTFADNDIVVKLRNDLVFPVFDLYPKENTILTPSEAGHGITPSVYDSRILCNDQILYGYKNVMDLYFDLPYKINLPFQRINGALQNYGELVGIEEMLRHYLYQKNINLETFSLNYKLLRFT
jgi:hypothetical protein